MHASTGQSGETSRALAAAVVAALTLLAFVLRARGIDFGLPHATHADARVLVEQVEALQAGERDPPGHRLYPHLVPRLAALSGGAEPALPPGANAAQHRARAGEPWLRTRWIALWCSLPLVPLTYCLARAVLARGAALFAAALVATSLLQLSFAQQERPHTALASATALAVLAALYLRRRPSWTTYALAGLAFALALGALHSGLAVLPALCAAHLLRRDGRRSAAGPAGILRPALPLAVAALSVPFFYPFHFDRPPAGEPQAARDNLRIEDQDGESVLNLSGHFVSLEAFDGSGFEEVAGSFYSYDPVLAALAALGLASLLVRRAHAGQETRRAALVLAAYALPYLVAIGLYARTPERFALPLTAFAAIAAARGAALLAARAPRAWTWALAGLLLTAPTYLAWRLGSLRAAPDTYAEAAGWIEAELPQRERVALLLDPHQDLPLVQTPVAAAANAAAPWPSPWSTYLAAAPALPPGRDLYVAPPPGRQPADLARDPVGVLALLGATHVVVELVPSGPKSEAQRAAHERLRAEAECRFRASPLAADDGTNERLFSRSVSWKRPMFARVLSSRCTGPTLEVFRLPQP